MGGFLSQDPYGAGTNPYTASQGFNKAVTARQREMRGQDVSRQTQLANKNLAVQQAQQQAIQARNSQTVGRGGIDPAAAALGMQRRLAEKLGRGNTMSHQAKSNQQAYQKAAARNVPMNNPQGQFDPTAIMNKFLPEQRGIADQTMANMGKDFSALHQQKAQQQIDAETKARKAMWGSRGMGEMMADEGVQSRAAQRNQQLMAEAQRMGWEDKQRATAQAHQNIDQMSGTDLRYALANLRGWESSTQMMLPLMERLGYGQGQLGIGSPRMG